MKSKMSNKGNKEIIFYFIRHGQTDWNLEDRIQGQTDIPLNEKGRSQAKTLKKKLEGIEFESCFSSDLQRASDTAHIIIKEHPPKIFLDKRLRERNFGDLEGKLSSAYINAAPQAFKNIESDDDFSQRIFHFLNEVINASPKGNILIVTHGGVMQTIILKLLQLKCRHFEIEIGNLAIIKLIVSNGNWNIAEISDIFLKDKGH